MAWWGCVFLGLAIGLPAGVAFLAAIVALARKLSARSLAFPKAEVSALTALMVFITGAEWARSKYFPIADPLCAQYYYLALAVVLVVVTFLPLYQLIRLCGIIVARRMR